MSWYQKAGKALGLAACYGVFALALNLPAAPAWSQQNLGKQNIGTAGAARFELNNGTIADEVVRLIRRIRAAARRCDAEGHKAAVTELRSFLIDRDKDLRSTKRDVTDPFETETPFTILTFMVTGVNVHELEYQKTAEERRWDAEDAAVLDSFRAYFFNSSEVRFPVPCPPPIDQAPQFRPNYGPPIWLTVQGGGLFTRGQGRNVTGTDVFTPAMPEVDRRSFSSSDTGGLIGATATVMLPVPTPFLDDVGGQIFVRSGFVANQGDDLIQNVTGINVTPMGSGTIRDNLQWYVPVLAGVIVPVTPHVSVELFGGVHVSRREASLSLTEAGAGPGGLPINASKSWTSVDPAVGGGLLFNAGRINGLPIRISVNGTVSFTGSESLNATSQNFATQSYQFETGRKVETSILFGIGVGLP